MSQTTTPPTKAERKAAARQARLERERAEAAAAHRRRRLLQLGGLLVAAAVIVGIAIAASSGGGSSTKTASSGGAVAGASESRAMLAGIPQNGLTLGNPKAPVTLVEFADPQCPFCKQYSLNEMPKVVRDYVRTGKVKMELRLLKFIGPDSVKAAQAIQAAAAQDKLWNAADLTYFNQGEENTGYVNDAFLRKVLGAVPGLDVDRALSQSGSPQVARALSDADAMATRYGVDSTPSFLVGPTGGTLKKVNVQSLTAGEIGQAIQQASTS
jgi:protein-disulfide isomerase